ncbi:MAG: hypothetical protein IT306_13580 [Chloroflexi bacterium]|nr:hypothetical protein [Chloroflexota bacterium]
MLARFANVLLAILVLAALFVAGPAGGVTSSLGTFAAPSSGAAVAHAQASLPAIPASWPSSLRSLQLGRASVPNEAAGMMARAPFGFCYQYLAGGVNTGNGWATWNADGQFVTYYVQESVASGVTPVFTYYMIYHSAPANGSGAEAAAVLGNLNNTSTMQAYYADLKLFFQRAGAFPNNTVVLHVEPDMWGYAQQAASSDNAATVAAKVGATGVSEVSGLPDTVVGVAQAVVRLRNLYAPNVILAYHLSDWGTGSDITLNDPSNSQVDVLGDRAAAFYRSLGADFDIAFGELSDHDSAFDQTYYGMGAEAWWNDADFTRHARFVGRFVQGSGKRMVLWQVPLGNTRMLAMNNTDHHFQDNRVEKLLDEPSRARLQMYVDAGVLAFLFGAGHAWATSPTDAAGDGVTNPAAINGNSQTSYNADDDGGFFHNRAAAYYTAGAMSVPSGVSGPPTLTPTPTATPAGATPTPTILPGAYTQSAVTAPFTVAAGGSTTVSATFGTGTAGSYLLDVEVYSPTWAKVHQQWFDNQSFAAGQHRTVQTTWSVPANAAPGVYTIMLGTFSPGWGTNYAWSASAATFTVTAAGAPTATPGPTFTPSPSPTSTSLPTATLTPTATATLPPVACSPRPPVSVSTAPVGGSLRVDLAATGANNRLLSVQVTQTTNALVDIGGQTGRTGAFAVSLNGLPTTTTFNIRRAAAGSATVRLNVVDRCGSWSTFVGGGPNGGFS